MSYKMIFTQNGREYERKFWAESDQDAREQAEKWLGLPVLGDDKIVLISVERID